MSEIITVLYPWRDGHHLQVLDPSGTLRVDPLGSGGPWFSAPDIAALCGRPKAADWMPVAQSLTGPAECWAGFSSLWTSAWGVPLLTDRLGTTSGLFAEWFLSDLADTLAHVRSRALSRGASGSNGPA